MLSYIVFLIIVAIVLLIAVLFAIQDVRKAVLLVSNGGVSSRSSILAILRDIHAHVSRPIFVRPPEKTEIVNVTPVASFAPESTEVILPPHTKPAAELYHSLIAAFRDTGKRQSGKVIHDDHEIVLTIRKKVENEPIL